MSALHATAVRLNGLGVLIRGPSGSGKSRLAMALLERAGAIDLVRRVTDEVDQSSRAQPTQAQPPQTQVSNHMPLDDCHTALIGDDYLNLAPADAGLNASPAKGLEGLLEVRGLGIVCLPWCTDAPIHLIVDMVPLDEMERLPQNHVGVIEGRTLNQLNIPVGDLAHQVLLVHTALKILPHAG